MASCATAAGSAPCAPQMTGTFSRSPQSLSCSTAAARKVSQAASSGGLAPRLHQMRQLGGGGGLARAVDADHAKRRSNLRRCFFNWRLGRAEAFFHFGAGDGKNIQPGAALRFVGLFDGGENLGGHGRAQVGGDQSWLPIPPACRAVSLGDAVMMRLISWASLA